MSLAFEARGTGPGGLLLWGLVASVARRTHMDAEEDVVREWPLLQPRPARDPHGHRRRRRAFGDRRIPRPQEGGLVHGL